jgi:phosphoenolpyruvate carboxylase
MRARVTQLWQTRMLRTAKLTVADEIENALSYYQTTFLREIPRLYREIERALPGHAGGALPAHGPLDRRRPRRQPQRHRRHAAPRAGAPGEVALRFYLTEVHELGAELSMSGTLAPRDAGDAGAGRRSPDHNPHREDEPYRRALIGMYARLAATLHALTGTEALRHAVAPQNPYASAAEFLADLR